MHLSNRSQTARKAVMLGALAALAITGCFGTTDTEGTGPLPQDAQLVSRGADLYTANFHAARVVISLTAVANE